MWFFIILLIILLLIGSGVLIFLQLGNRNTPPPACSYSTKDVFTSAEGRFLQALDKLQMENVLIMGKVRLADIFQVKGGNYRQGLNRITSKHVDFLLIDKHTCRPILAIELDDSSHEKPERIARDQFVDQVFQKAGLPLIHLKPKHSYELTEILTAIQQKAPVSSPITPAPPPKQPTIQRTKMPWDK